MTWPTIPFERLFSLPTRNGLTRPSRVRGDGYKMINMGELFAYDRISADVYMDRVPMSERELDNMLVEPGDLIFARQSLVLSGAGKCSIVTSVDEPTTFESHLIRVRLDRNTAHPDFFYYHFKALSSGIRSIVTQGVQAGIRASDLAKLPVQLPPLKTQHAIAETLAEYDGLIGINERRMTLLDEAARQLYREWFVRLRFPGYEHTRVANSVPEGWVRKTIAELCESISYGYTASAEQEAVGPKFLRITDIVPADIDWASVPYCPIEEARLAKFRLIAGDIVIARTGATVGYAKRLHKRHPEAVFASYLVRLRLSPDVSNIMVGVFVESDAYKAHVQSRLGGAAQPNANARVLSAADILVPPRSLQREFDGFVEPLLDQREILHVQNQQLRAARDLLLPRLMSGEIAL